VFNVILALTFPTMIVYMPETTLIVLSGEMLCDSRAVVKEDMDSQAPLDIKSRISIPLCTLQS
jgi:hypothetical protein